MSLLTNNGRRGTVVGLTKSTFVSSDKVEVNPERHWVVVFYGGRSLSLLSREPMGSDPVELKPDFLIISFRMAESSYARGARAAIAISLQDGSETHLEIEGPYGPILYPSAREVVKILEIAKLDSRH
jgi:hypothetical protein